MKRSDIYRQDLNDFKTYSQEAHLTGSENNLMLDEIHREYEITMLCDLADAICEIAKSMEGIKSEVSQIRRQMRK